jgi:hypothetical protein
MMHGLTECEPREFRIFAGFVGVVGEVRLPQCGTELFDGCERRGLAQDSARLPTKWLEIFG